MFGSAGSMKKMSRTVTSEIIGKFFRPNGMVRKTQPLSPGTNGNEIDHLFSADLETKKVRDLTPFPESHAKCSNRLQHPKRFVALNKHDPHAFDMYRVDIEAGPITLEAENPGDVLTWKTDKELSFAPQPPSMARLETRSFVCVIRSINLGAISSRCPSNVRFLEARWWKAPSSPVSIRMGKV